MTDFSTSYKYVAYHFVRNSLYHTQSYEYIVINSVNIFSAAGNEAATKRVFQPLVRHEGLLLCSYSLHDTDYSK